MKKIRHRVCMHPYTWSGKKNRRFSKKCCHKAYAGTLAKGDVPRYGVISAEGTEQQMLHSLLGDVLIHQKVPMLAVQERTSALSCVFFPSLTCSMYQK